MTGSGMDKARELIRKFSTGELSYEQFIELMDEIDVHEIDLTLQEPEPSRPRLGIRAQAAAERIRRL